MIWMMHGIKLPDMYRILHLLAVEEVGLHGDRLILLFLGLISVITVIPKYYRNTMMA